MWPLEAGARGPLTQAPPHPRALRRAFAGAVAAAAVGVAVTLAGCGGETAVDCESFRFSQTDWRLEGSDHAKGEQDSRRQTLADGLVECGQLKGSRRSAVKALLGRPDRSWSTASSWSYRIGPDRRDGGHFKIKDEALFVNFDQSGKVLDVSMSVR